MPHRQCRGPPTEARPVVGYVHFAGLREVVLRTVIDHGARRHYRQVRGRSAASSSESRRTAGCSLPVATGSPCSLPCVAGGRAYWRRRRTEQERGGKCPSGRLEMGIGPGAEEFPGGSCNGGANVLAHRHRTARTHALISRGR